MTKKQFLDRLKRACVEVGSQSAFARRVGVPAQFISNILNGYAEPSPKVLDALGIVRKVERISRVTYEEKHPQDAA